jgi:signal peptidase I
MTTFILFGVLFATMVLAAIVWGALLQLGLRWAKVPGGTLLRSSLLWLLVAIPSLVFIALLQFLLSTTPESSLVAAAGGFGIGFFVQTSMIAWYYRASFAVAVKAWLPTLLSGVVAYPLAIFVIRPFLFEAYVIPTNSMAPTLVGEHVIGRCPDCGAPMYGSPNPYPQHSKTDKPIRMICANFHSHQSAEYNPGTSSLDRILAAKFLLPRRWDLAVFRNPENKTQNYVKRVVGLPGETVTIRDGAIFINGAKIDPPTELQGIRYVTTIPDDYRNFEALWGTMENPAELGPNEYFVLGDNTTAAHDSRFWQGGADGHSPYAVPKSDVIGVATHIYWPPERMRVLR